MFNKMFKVIVCFILLLSLLSCSLRANAASPFIETENLTIENFSSIQDAYNSLIAYTIEQDTAHKMAECARQLGYNEDNIIIVTARVHWNEAEKNKQESVDYINHMMECFNEYPYATYVWLYLRDVIGCNEAQAAGILGNMVAECGGATLNLHYWAYGSGGFYYGLCQWGKTWFPEVRGMDLREQCDYLKSNIETQINAFGKSYGKENAYAEFLQLESYREAALMFAKMYEACAASGYYVRQNYAEMAYNYFMGLN